MPRTAVLRDAASDVFFLKVVPGEGPWTASNAEGLEIFTGYELIDRKVYGLATEP